MRWYAPEGVTIPVGRGSRIPFAGLLLFIVTMTAALGYQLLPSSSSTAASSVELSRSEHPGALAPVDAPSTGSERHRTIAPVSGPPGAFRPRIGQRGALATADGAVPAGTSVFDEEIPGVANLDPSLLGALRQAATDAANDGVELFVNSGWRSPEYQEQLFQEAVSKYGSEREAARWVAAPSTSAHVSGDAVDVGFAATAWLSKRGAEYGLCQIYRNELWHYELRPEAGFRGCPAMYTDPTHDPRMQQ